MTELNPSEPTSVCPECGNEIPEDSTHSLCPACLVHQALKSTIVNQGEGGTDSPPPPSPEEIADTFPGFEIIECLGRGGMGVVYQARQKSLDRMVAIKILAPERVGDKAFATRFSEEAQTLARLSHQNIVTVFDYGEAQGLYYIVMEFVDGVNLRDLLKEGKLAPEQALAIVPPICEALQFAHDKGIVHRDIKPENLLLDREGKIKIADFGIASLVGAAGDPAGTPPYMAPEQGSVHREVDHRADIYALGVVLYETLTGERPEESIDPPSQKVAIDISIDDIVLRALNHEPSRRYRSVDEFRSRIETVTAGPSDRHDLVPELSSNENPKRWRDHLKKTEWICIYGWCMISLGVLNLLFPIISVLLILYFGDAEEYKIFDNGLDVGPFGVFPRLGFETLFSSVLTLILISALIILGGRRLQDGTSRLWTIVGGIACCFTTALWPAGIILGVIAIASVIINKKLPASSSRDSWSNFGKDSKLSILAVVATFLTVFMIIGVSPIFSYLMGYFPRWSEGQMEAAFFLFGLPGCVCAWIAAGVINQSEGRVHGRWLAIFSGLSVPIFVAFVLLIDFLGFTSLPRPDLFANQRIDDALVGLIIAASIVLLLRFCYLCLSGQPKQFLYSGVVRFFAILLLLSGVSLGGLAWYQKTVSVGKTVTSMNPKNSMAIGVSTRTRSQLFKPDIAHYHFRVLDINGDVKRDFEIPVPLLQLSDSLEGVYLQEHQFDKAGKIIWDSIGGKQTEGKTTAAIHFQDQLIYLIEIDSEGQVHGRYP